MSDLRTKNAEFFKRLAVARDVVMTLDSVPGDVLANLSSKLEVEIQRTYSDESDPYGSSWTPRKDEGDGHPILDDTGRMRRSFVLRIRKKGVHVVNTAKYATFHQFSTYKMPARPIFPSSDQGYPKAWLQAFREEIFGDIQRRLSRVGFQERA